MIKLAIAATLFVAAPALAQDTTPPAAPTGGTAPAKPTPEQIAKDPRMLAAIRHANATADHKCGESGGFDSLEVKTAARACRKRMVDAAKLDAESEIEGR